MAADPDQPITRGRSRPARAFAAAVAVCGCAVGVGACGSSAPPHRTAIGSSHYRTALAFSKCMRSHGVTNFPDPGSSGGIQIQASSGVNPFSPSFKAAQSTCRRLFPAAGPPSGKASAKQVQQAMQTAACMRAHGVSGFPDPTTTPPSSPSGYSIIEDRDGVVIAIPSTIDVNSPAFRRASATCHFS